MSTQNEERVGYFDVVPMDHGRLSLRDYFAAHAMHVRADRSGDSPLWIAHRAYVIADAMLEMRNLDLTKET